MFRGSFETLEHSPLRLARVGFLNQVWVRQKPHAGAQGFRAEALDAIGRLRGLASDSPIRVFIARSGVALFVSGPVPFEIESGPF